MSPEEVAKFVTGVVRYVRNGPPLGTAWDVHVICHHRAIFVTVHNANIQCEKAYALRIY